MDIENLGDVWQAGGRLYVRCAKPRRDGLKSVRACGRRHELDVQTLIWTRGVTFPISMLSGRMKCPACQKGGCCDALAARQRARSGCEGGGLAMSGAIVLDHIRALIDHHYQLRVTCYGCRHNQVLDLQALGERLGFDHSAMHDDMTPKLKCSKCGSTGRKKLALTLSFNGPGMHGRT